MRVTRKNNKGKYTYNLGARQNISVLFDKLGPLEDIEERIPLEDIERILDATDIYAILTNGFDIEIKTTFEIEKVTSKGLWLKKNEYDMSFAPFKDYKKGWALTRKELE